MKKGRIAATVFIVLVVIAILFVSCGGENAKRLRKSIFSNYTGGLDRTVTLYDYEGDVLRTWSGKIDLTESQDELMFDLNGKRTVIQGGIRVIDEN